MAGYRQPLLMPRPALQQRRRSENGMYRYKRIIGDALRARRSSAQRKEAMIAVNVINKMTQLGMPVSRAVVA